ncbi:MAG: hypothetical protein ACD_75C01979G0001 [uncultured bacterium]|nr:MAG: hypothetical protein ACD_75C01979G0001 [uncultured bacterium]
MCGLAPWQEVSEQEIKTLSLAQLLGSCPVGILWFFALWQSTQTIPLAACASVSLLKVKPRFTMTPPPAASWQTMQFFTVGLPMASAALVLLSCPITT